MPGKARKNKEKQGRKKENKNQKKETKKQKKEKKEAKLSRGKRDQNSEAMKKDHSHAKAKGSLSGIATLRRVNDVKIIDEETYKVITSTFSVGPLDLSVSKSVRIKDLVF